MWPGCRGCIAILSRLRCGSISAPVRRSVIDRSALPMTTGGEFRLVPLRNFRHLGFLSIIRDGRQAIGPRLRLRCLITGRGMTPAGKPALRVLEDQGSGSRAVSRVSRQVGSSSYDLLIVRQEAPRPSRRLLGPTTSDFPCIDSGTSYPPSSRRVGAMWSRCAPATSPIGPIPVRASTKAPCCEWLHSRPARTHPPWTCKPGSSSASRRPPGQGAQVDDQVRGDVRTSRIEPPPA